MTRPVLVASLLGAAVASSAAAGASAQTGVPIGLPSSTTPLTQAPPLRTNAQLFREEATYRGHLSSDERVLVKLGPRGRPTGVRVVQRIVVLNKGDYTFVVPAPALDVAAGAGSESQPGLRRGAIIWRGFSAARRTLVADARLRVADAAPFLPVLVTLRANASRTTLVLENATGVRTYAYTADVDRQHAVAALRRIRAAIRRGADVPAASLTARATPKVTTVRAVAPLRVEGELQARRDAPPKRFSAVLGDGSATRLRLVFDRRLPLLTLRVRPIPPRRMLASDRGNGRELFDRAFAAMRTLARVRQYQQFLINPDPLGRSHATYIYRTAAATRERLAPVQPRDSNSAGTVVAVVLLAASAAGLAVVWAHS